MSEPTGIQRYNVYGTDFGVVKEADGGYVLYADLAGAGWKAMRSTRSKPLRRMSDAYARGDNRQAVLLAEIERLVALVDARDAQLATVTTQRDEWHQRWEACLQRQEEEFMSMLKRVEETAALKEQLATAHAAVWEQAVRCASEFGEAYLLACMAEHSLTPSNHQTISDVIHGIQRALTQQAQQAREGE